MCGKIKQRFNFATWSPWLINTMVYCALFIIVSAVVWLCAASSLKPHTIIDVLASIVALILFFIIACFFYEGKLGERKTKGYYWLPISLIITVLIMLFGVVIFNPSRQTLPIENVEFCGCALSFQQMAREAGISACPIDGTQDRDNIKLEPFLIRDDYFENGMKEKMQTISISFKDMLRLCCAKNADDYIDTLGDIKYEKIKNDKSAGLLEAFMLDEMALNILQKAMTNCSCNNSKQNCNIYLAPLCDKCSHKRDEEQNPPEPPKNTKASSP